MPTQWKGNPYQTPVPLRTRRETEEGGVSPRSRTRSRQPVQIDCAGADEEQLLDEPWPPRPHTTVRRYDMPDSSQTTRQLSPKPTRVIRLRRFSSGWILVLFGIGMMIMVVGWIAVSALGQWWQSVQEGSAYGMPRTFQMDEYVNQGDTPAQPDHFVGLNIHDVVLVIEVNPQHNQDDHIYFITTTTDPTIPVTISFREVNGQQRMDVAIGQADSTPYMVELVNNGKQFVSPQSH